MCLRANHFQVRDLWRAVDAFYVAQSAERDVVASVLQEAESKYRLDATEINVQVPEMLLRECQQELQRVGQGIFNHGKSWEKLVSENLAGKVSLKKSRKS